ncbi:MAG: PPOX class F420-dependent oxidoreductase [Nitrosopumilus sp.]|nr:PPOX class F420-dependent oxidoreductase [Nitrosopumilus sp.]MDH3487661.1 PPOX class F420-dependent oxidoreductase [Nitrosopumilus sp.]
MLSLDEIKSKKYILLETYRKNYQPVQTPVWFVVKNDLVYVVTRSQTGKVKRLQNNLKVKFALCNIKGKIAGEWISGTAKILTDKETKEAVKMRDQKYGFMAKIAKFVSKSKGEFFAFSIKID